MTSKTASSVKVRWAFGLIAMALSAWVMATSSCQVDDNGIGVVDYGAGAGSQSTSGVGGGCFGPNCEQQCAKHPHPGCACDVEGQHLLCGKVDATLGGQPVCGKGFSVCTAGVWADCIIDNAVTIVPNPPPGYYPDDLSGGANCVSNPCDPSCIDFQDTPGGLDGGSGLSTSDAGITLSGDGGAVCVKRTCADLGKNCGPVSDTCGGLLQCGTCQAPQTCGGTGIPSVCGTNVACTNLCLQQVICPNSGTTSITGTVYAPNGVQPLPNVVVYVPNAAVAPFSAGVSCDNCLQASGQPLVSTTTAVDGTFTLNNMPVGTNIPLVIQVGRWRRQVVIPSTSACSNTPVAATLTRFPKNHTEGDIPKMAFVTGQVDGMECVWRKIGIDDAEFTNPSGTGRINFYAGSGSPGTGIGYYGAGGTEWDTVLLGSAANLAKYDMVLFPCQGGQYIYNQQTTFDTNLSNYLNAGGRVFATHFSYIWLYNDGGSYLSPLGSAVNWNINQGSPADQTGFIDQSFPKGTLLAQWLKLGAVGASTTLGQIPVNTLRRDFNSVVAPTQNWLTYNNPVANRQLHLTFNTPLAAAPANQCGRVVFSDFHVENASNTQVVFPGECNNAAMTPQEKMLEFMLFDLASCVTPDIPPPCTPITCGAQGLNCGPAGDGCGGTLNCGTCTAPQTCGGGGPPGVCGTPFVYNDAYFIRDYDGSICPAGTSPVWELWSWSSITPTDSHIDFSVQTAATKAGIAAAPSNPILFSNPPGPAALVSTATSAHQANVPLAGKPDTELGSAAVDYTLQTDNVQRNWPYLRVTAHLVPSSDKLQAPILTSWDLQLSCPPSE